MKNCGLRFLIYMKAVPALPLNVSDQQKKKKKKRNNITFREGYYV